jgi:energy-coupling factor transport system permease protein
VRIEWQQERATPLGRLDARLKLALGFFMSCQAVLLDRPPALAALALLGLAVFLAGRPGRFQMRLALGSIALLVWGIMLSQAFFYSQHPRTVLAELVAPGGLLPEGIRIYREGFAHGFVQSARLVAVGLTGYAICFSTGPDAFLRALVALRMPFSLSFMAVTAIRFIPVVADEALTVRTAMRLKGYRPFRRGLRDTLRTELAWLRPVLIGAVRRSEEVALAVVTRGFAFGRPRTSLEPARMGAGQRAFAGLLGVVLLGTLTMKVLFWLYLTEAFYLRSLRPLYEFTRTWL